VKALASVLQEQFAVEWAAVEWAFWDHPTGL